MKMSRLQHGSWNCPPAGNDSVTTGCICCRDGINPKRMYWLYKEVCLTLQKRSKKKRHEKRSETANTGRHRQGDTGMPCINATIQWADVAIVSLRGTAQFILIIASISRISASSGITTKTPRSESEFGVPYA